MWVGPPHDCVAVVSASPRVETAVGDGDPRDETAHQAHDEGGCARKDTEAYGRLYCTIQVYVEHTRGSIGALDNDIVG